MAGAVKRIAEGALVGSGVARFARRRRRGETLVLAYHNIVPSGEVVRGDTSLHLQQGEFGRQLDLLGQTHDIVPLNELASPARSERPRAVITFDDAYRGAVSAGLAELVKRGLPATIFVAPAFVGGRAFWWDVLAGDSGLSDEVRETVLQKMSGLDERVRAWARTNKIETREVPPHETAASEADLRAAVGTGLITLASHTWSHPNLAALSDADVEHQLRAPLEWLRARFSAVVPWISYPYGLHAGRVEQLAQSAGYTGGFLIAGGWFRHAMLRERPYSLPRLNVPAGVTLRGFELRTAGVLSA